MNYAEQNKVSVLKNSIKRKRLLKKYGSSDSLLFEENSLLKEQRRLTVKLFNQPISREYIKAHDSLRSKLIEISTKLKSLKNTIDEKYAINNKISLKDIKTRIGDKNSAIIEYFYGKNSIFQFVFTKNEYQLNRLSINETTTKKISEFISYFDDAAIINSNISGFTDDSFSVFKLLNFDAVNTIEDVIIIPDGLINFIPFEALLYNKTLSTSFDKMPFVVNRQTLSYNSNLEFYLNPVNKRTEDIILGVFPVFKGSNRELLYTINEAEGVEKYIQGKFILHEEASKENFTNRINDYSILHLSTHASSGDFVNPATISFSNASMTIDELYGLDINPSLVVLSACETGVGKLFKGEVPLSIARGFQYAGAENILFSQWQINDLSTSTLMTSFYRYYSEGKSAVYANRQSKIDYLHNTKISNAKKSPYYWCAFIFYGDYQEMNTSNSSFFLWGLCIVGLLIIVFLAYKFKSKNA